MKITNAKRIVVKVGSSLLIKGGTLDYKWIASLSDDIANLKNNAEIIIVSSGAVALGKDVLGVKALRIEEKQAAAACGQIALIDAYRKSLSKHHLSTAQILLTIEDSDDRRRYLNAKNTIETLLSAGIIPIINENDTVATTEIKFGDNDRLAARVAQMISADLLILLSDVDGLYTENPHTSANATHIPEIKKITSDIEKMADGSTSEISSGGMITKIAAAKIAVASGCNTIIACGTEYNPLRKNKKHTIFFSDQTPYNAKKRWIAHTLNVRGKIVIDEGAINALQHKKSLLPIGVISVSGTFNRGDAVLIMDKNGNERGRGLIAYSINDAERIIGQKTIEIKNILGYSGRDELIHYDDMVLLK